MIKVNILGSTWKIRYQTIDQNKTLNTCDGYTDASVKTIVIRRYRKKEHEVVNINEIYMENIRHEIMHAFMFESGLWVNTNSSNAWSMNEEMIDWFAKQSPKIYKVYKKLEVI